MERRHLDPNESPERSDRPPLPKPRAEKGSMRTGAESSGHSGAMQAVSELSKRVLSPDHDNITRADLQDIVESTQEHTEQSRTERKRKASSEIEAPSEQSKTQSEQMNEVYKDPAHQKKQKKTRSKNMREISTNLWKDLRYQKMHREKMRETSKKLWENPEHRENISRKASKNMQERWKNLEHREKMQEAKAKRKDENLTIKYGSGSRKDAKIRQLALKKAWQTGTLPDTPDKPPSD